MPTLFAALTPGLVPVRLDVPTPPAMPLYMITHRAIRQSPRIRVVWEFLDGLLRFLPSCDDRGAPEDAEHQRVEGPAGPGAGEVVGDTDR